MSSMLKDWKEESLAETDESLPLIEEMKRIENRHRQIIALSSDLEEAYHIILQKTKI